MPETETARQFRITVRRHLDPHSSAIVSVLEELIRYPFVPEVRRIDFEVFCDDFKSGLPIRAFFLDENNTEYFLHVGGKAKYPCSVPPELLDVDGIYPDELEQGLAASDPAFDFMTAAGEVAVVWFAECWKKADGQRFTRKATIGLHDDARRYDLVRQMWIPDADPS